jgi:hypothetical protein
VPALSDPANYSGGAGTTQDGASTSQLRTLSRQQGGKDGVYCTTEDPAAFTWTGSQSWSSVTVSVRPPV